MALAAVPRGGLARQPLGRFAVTLRDLPAKLWQTPLSTYADLTLDELYQRKTHGKKRIAVVVDRHEDDDAMRGLAELAVLGIARVHVHRHVHAGLPGVDHAGMDLHEAAQQYRLVESNASHINGHAVVGAPPNRAGKTRLIDPLHDGSAMHLAAKVKIRGLSKKSQGYFALSSSHDAQLQEDV